MCRWDLVFRDDSVGLEGSPDDEREAAAGGDYSLERGHVRDVRVHAPGVPHQERRIPIPLAAILRGENMYHYRVHLAGIRGFLAAAIIKKRQCILGFSKLAPRIPRLLCM